MTWLATATIGGAIIGGVASDRASKRAAKGASDALDVSTAATKQARGDVAQLFKTAGESRKAAFDTTLDFLSGAPSKQIAPFQGGNVLAQEQISRGLPQIRNAILGLETDLSGFTPRTVGTPESFNFDLSGLRPEPVAATPGTTTPGASRFAGSFGPPRRGLRIQ